MVRGQVTSPGYEHVKWEMVVEAMVPERLFSFRWHPYAVDATVDYSTEPQTLVEFRLEDDRRRHAAPARPSRASTSSRPGRAATEALRMNEGGWTEQMRNIERHVRENP